LQVQALKDKVMGLADEGAEGLGGQGGKAAAARAGAGGDAGEAAGGGGGGGAARAGGGGGHELFLPGRVFWFGMRRPARARARLWACWPLRRGRGAEAAPPEYVVRRLHHIDSREMQSLVISDRYVPSSPGLG